MNMMSLTVRVMAVVVTMALSVSGHTIREPEMPSAWRRIPLSSEHKSAHGHSFMIALKQSEKGMEALRTYAQRVSNPQDALYAKYLSQEEVDSYVLPEKHVAEKVLKWASATGCEAKNVRELVHVRCKTLESAEQLLETKFHMAFSSHTSQSKTRAGDVFIPEEIRSLVQTVYGLHGLPLPPRATPVNDVGSPANVTPAVISSAYQISGVTPSKTSGNKQAVAEFQGQTMDPSDLKTFFKTYVPSSTDDTVSKFVGDPGTGQGGVEASLDIQYIMGVAPGIATEFWYQKNQDFCADLASWTNAILNDANPPLVHSVSYGWQGNLQQIGCTDANVKTVDDDFTKLVAKGITIIFASGDSGSGYSPGSACMGTSPGKNNTGIIGTVLRNETVVQVQQCCEVAGSAKGWEFVPKSPGPAPKPYCTAANKKTDTVLEGTLIYKATMSSEAECCSFASHVGESQGYSYVPSTSSCSLFRTVTGSKAQKGTTSIQGMPPAPPGGGTCIFYSDVQKTTTKTGHIAGGPSVNPQKPTLYPSWPASSPSVTSVGATRFIGQKAGNAEMATDQFGSGGGFSTMFTAFDSQASATKAYLANAPQLPPKGSYPPGGRGTPDVSALGEGFRVLSNGRDSPVGGTSASAPTFAAVVSLLNEALLQKGHKQMGNLNQWIYQNTGAFTDVTVGTNAIGRGTGPIAYGFNCTKGWDPATGVGTPIFPKMLAAAIAAHEQTTTPS
jgi:subtilase family serine protease